MRLLQQAPQSFELAMLQRIDERVDPSDLRINMAAAIRLSSLCLAATLVVGRASQRAVLARIDDSDKQLFGKRNNSVLERAAVQQKRVTAPAQRGRELVHHAYLDTCRLAFCALARQCRLDSVQVGLQPRGNCNQERGGRAEARP